MSELQSVMDSPHAVVMGQPRARRMKRADVIAVSIAAGLTDEQVAQAARVHVRTVQRYRLDPGFMAQVESLRAQAIDRITGQIGEGAGKGMATLLELCGSARSESVRYQAAAKLVELGVRVGGAEAPKETKVTHEHTLTGPWAELLPALRAAVKRIEERQAQPLTIEVLPSPPSPPDSGNPGAS